MLLPLLLYCVLSYAYPAKETQSEISSESEEDYFTPYDLKSELGYDRMYFSHSH